MNLALNNLQRLICHKTKTTNQLFAISFHRQDEYDDRGLSSTVEKQVVARHYLTRARGVVIIAVGNEHGDTSSNPGRD